MIRGAKQINSWVVNINPSNLLQVNWTKEKPLPPAQKTYEQTVEIKQELIDETSRNPKRKHSSASQGDESSEKLPKDWSSGNYGEDVMFKEVFRPNKDKKETGSRRGY